MLYGMNSPNIAQKRKSIRKGDIMNDLDEIFVTSAERQTSPSPKKKDWKEERNALFKLAS